MPDDALTPDEIEQRQSAFPEDEDAGQDLYDTDEPLDPDQIEQRIEAGFDEDDAPGEA